MTKHTVLFLLIAVALSSCDLTQQIEIELPEVESEVFVEGYLEPGNPVAVVLTQTVGFYDDLRLIYVKDAIVSLSYNNQTDTLISLEIPLSTPGLELLLDTASVNRFRNFLGEEVVLYGTLAPVPALYDTPFTLRVTTQEGEELLATTYIPRPVEFEEPIVRFNDEDRALILTRFQDDPNTRNFFRRVLSVREPEITENEDGTQDTVWVTNVEQDFLADDQLNNGEIQTFGTLYDYQVGDTITHTIISVTEAYSEFATTRDAAIGASLSPFGQPARLKGNIEGGQGIFTGQSRARQMTIIKK